MLLFGRQAPAQEASDPPGSIRGVVLDQDFDVPLPAARVRIVETDQEVTTTDQGTFFFGDVPAGAYTLVFSKEDFVRVVRADVVVVAGRLTDVNAALAGEFLEMDELVVQDIQIGSGTEAALLELRFESPSLLDSISAELMSRAGASDAASALRLVPGASVQDGRFAVIRGLPDRYVSSQMNGVRLPSADEDTRAVELDQFPAAVIESIQVSKTFTPDQQGDASGGAVDVRLRTIPEEAILQFEAQFSHNTQIAGRKDFLTYRGGGVETWGKDDSRRLQAENVGGNWDGAVGVSRGEAPIDFKWSAAAGGKTGLGGLEVGGFANFFYERDSSFHDDGVDDSYWVEDAGEPLTPETKQGTVQQGGSFKTALFDVTKSTASVQWGGLATLGVKSEDHSLGLAYLYTRTAEDTATLAEDTRGKAYFFPGHDPDDPTGPGNEPGNRFIAPYIRTETLEYTERTTGTLQLSGRHELPLEAGPFGAPELDWTVALSSADLGQPGKRQFGSLWLANSTDPGIPPFIPPSDLPNIHLPFKPSANFTLGNLQRIFKEIEEESDQFFLNLRLPFEQWQGEEGYVKLGYFDDRVDRFFAQDTFSNFADSGIEFQGGWDELWSENFPFEDHPISASLFDVDYEGEQAITASYGMIDMPLGPDVNLVGGARFESTDITVVNHPEEQAIWFRPGETAAELLEPGEADVLFSQDDVLPSIGVEFRPTEKVTVRASYAESVARQTFKELTPVVQQEFLGGPVFIGNPELRMSNLRNYDLRVDYEPYEGGLVSLSAFDKDLEGPIEYVQRIVTAFSFTTAVNYPAGRLRGLELELRQGLDRVRDELDGFSIGANATVIDSEVTLTEDEVADFADVEAPMTTRDATNAPDHLYNLYLTYDRVQSGTRAALFYTVQGDTLVRGAGVSSNSFIPSVYAREFGTLNLTVSQAIGDHLQIKLQAKNLTDPLIEEVFRSDYTGDDVTNTAFRRGREFSIGITFSN